MRNILLLMFLTAFQVFAGHSYSQHTRMSLDLRDATVESVLNSIEDQSEFYFLVNKKLVDVNRKISLNLEDQNINHILAQVFEGTDVEYVVMDRQIVLSPGEYLNMVKNKLQPLTVTGTVTDENGEPLPGLSVYIKGTTRGSVTGLDGEFTIQVDDPSATLVFSYVGYISQEVAVGDQTTINISMEPDILGLEEVVVVGYGTQKKSDIVGSISTVSEAKIAENTHPNLNQALQAAAPGILISRGSGEPGVSGSIRIRGLTSISASNDPLVVLDGIPFAGSIRDINPYDIQSVEILKDASASAIYGSRAANGVILITSKGGITSGTTVELNASWSFQNEAVPFELMGPDEFYDFRKEGFRADGLLDGVAEADIPALILEVNELKSYERGESVDWMDEMINQNALVQNYQLSVRTGNENLRDYLSVSFNDEEGLQRTTGFSRLTLKNNLELTGIADWLRIGDNILYTYNDYERREFSINNQPAYYRLSPFARIYEDDGTFTKHPQANDDLFVNPIAEDELTARENRFNNLFNNIFIELTPPVVNGLSFRMNFGTNLRNTYNAKYLRRGTFIGDAVGGQAAVQNSTTLDLTWENILNYSREFAGHSIDLTGLYSRQYNRYNYNFTEASGFVSDDYLWHNMGAAELIGAPQSTLNEWNLVSYMARLNYNYNQKYYLTVTGRRDGYSGFATNKKYGFFPSFALAWRVSRESFMEGVDWLSDWKLRVSYGSVGNQAVGTYRSLARLGLAQHFFGEELTAGLRVTSLPNEDLGWETTKTLNVATDVSILSGRISATLEYYDAQTFDILLSRSIPAMTGQNSITFNIGQVQNTGFEAMINAVPVQQGDFIWRTNLNFSTNKNQIVDLYGDEEDDVGNRWFIGEPLGIIYGVEADGIYQLGDEDEIANSPTPDREPGDVRIVDQDGDGAIDDEDEIILGYTEPNWTGGWGNTFSWKGLSLFVFVQTVQGVDKRYNPEGSWGGRVNRPPVNYWTPENPSNEWFRPHQGSIPYTGSINLFDGSFTRIKDITLSYNLPGRLLSNIPVTRVRVYANLHDYFTFTDYPYADPEISYAYEMSIPKYIQFGFNVTF